LVTSVLFVLVDVQGVAVYCSVDLDYITLCEDIQSRRKSVTSEADSSPLPITSPLESRSPRGSNSTSCSGGGTTGQVQVQVGLELQEGMSRPQEEVRGGDGEVASPACPSDRVY
jgi:hypothetical protein